MGQFWVKTIALSGSVLGDRQHSIGLNGGIGIASLFHLARQAGWRDTLPRPSRAEIMHGQLKARIEAERAEADKVQRQLLEAESARIVWGQANEADPNHAYLVRKHIKPHGIRQIGSTLLIPMQDALGELWNIQSIALSGKKLFRQGRAAGLYAQIGSPKGESTLVVAEGFATGSTIHEQTGFPVLCALSASNVIAVAHIARSMRPDGDLLICGDDDRHAPSNAGRKFATEAATLTGARLTFPEFEDGEEGTDFNDWYLNRLKVTL